MPPKTLVLFNGDSHFPETKKILGIPWRERITAPARKEGFEESQDWTREVLILPSTILLSADFWKKLSQARLDEETLLTSQEDVPFVLVRTHNAGLLKKAISQGDAAQAILNLKSSLKTETIPVTPKDWIPCRDDEDLPAVALWLLQGLVKESEGFMSRHLERKISLSLTRLLVRTGVTPNQMTWVSTMTGFVGATFFLSPLRAHHVLGSILFWAHSVLDGCDGEIARLKFLESRWGGILDFWSDNAVHCAVFGCIAAGSYKVFGAPFFFWLGTLAVLGTMGSAGFVYWTTMRKKKGAGPLFTSTALESGGGKSEESTRKIIDFLARRDFIYLVLLLSIFGKIHWFLWMGAAGAPLYFLILITLNSRNQKS